MGEICYGCFSQLAKGGACHHCGYDPGEDIGKYPAALKPGTILNNRYILGRVLGQGGFGITYAALDKHSGERVALKEYLPTDFQSTCNIDIFKQTLVPQFSYRIGNLVTRDLYSFTWLQS